jgi:hypothetical protein
MARVGPVDVWSLGKETVDTLWRVYGDLGEMKGAPREVYP